VFVPGVIVLEKRPRWEAELKRSLRLPVSIRPCRLPPEVGKALETMPGSVVVLDFEIGAGEVLRLVEQLSSRVPRPDVIVVAAAPWAELEWALREAGALDFLIDATAGPQLVRCCRSLLEPANAAESPACSGIVSPAVSS